MIATTEKLNKAKVGRRLRYGARSYLLLPGFMRFKLRVRSSHKNNLLTYSGICPNIYLYQLLSLRDPLSLTVDWQNIHRMVCMRAAECYFNTDSCISDMVVPGAQEKTKKPQLFIFGYLPNLSFETLWVISS